MCFCVKNTKDFRSFRQSVKNNAICMVLNRWKTNRKIEQIAEAKYKKL